MSQLPSPRRTRGLTDPSVTLFRVRGIAVGAHWTMAPVAALVTWTLGSRLFPRTYPGLMPSTYWVMALAATLAFFASILLHELGHALTADRRGTAVDGITLWLFGGVTRYRVDTEDADLELATSAAGLVVTAALTVLLGAAAIAGSRAGWSRPLEGVVDYLARINLLLLVFNAVPAFPLDGGRVFRAWLWKRRGDRVSATFTAARAGRAFGAFLVASGLLGFFSGANTGGLWLAFIGWFLVQAGAAEAGQAELRHAFQGVRVRDLMTPDPELLSPATTVLELVDRAIQPGHPSSYPVVDGGALVGFASYRQAGAVARNRWSRTPVARIMTSAGDIPVLSPDEPVVAALAKLREGPGRAVVVDGGSVAGVLSLNDVARALEIHERHDELVAERAARASGRRFKVLSTVGVTLALLFATSAVYHPAIYVLAPGPTYDVSKDITLSGTPTHPLHGKYLLATVSLEQPTAYQALLAMFHSDREIISADALVPKGESADQYLAEQQVVFDQSRRLAAAAAAKAVGLPVEITGSGAVVRETLPGAPAAAVLRPGDVIIRMNHRAVHLASDGVEQIQSRPAGTRLRLIFYRHGARHTATIRTARLQGVPGTPVGIGAVLETRDFRVDLPFDISFAKSDIGGPSAGLAYALAITDMLDTTDDANGRIVAATGTIDVDGQVGAIGGAHEKAAGVRAAGANLFLVPTDDLADARIGGLDVRGVGTLDDALAALRATV